MSGSSFNDYETLTQDPEIKKFLAGFASVEEKIENPEENDSTINENTPNHKAPGDFVSKKPFPSLRELSFIRLIDPVHIPSYLVEQIKDRLYSVEQFYRYQKVACLIQTPEGPEINGGNLLYALTHERLRQVKGFLWMVVDILTNSLVVNNFSVDREYWNKGESTLLLEEKAKKVMKDLSLSRIVWITKNPRFCENKGFKRTKDAVMIYEEED